jgi:hypothetical protein
VCFAPEADAVVGGIIVVVGVDALRHVGPRRQLALASLPLLFGLHQLTEAFVWWGLQDHVAHVVERIAIWAYLGFAFVMLPVLLPAAVALIERSTVRRRAVLAFTGLGVVVAIALGTALVRGPVNAVIDGRHIVYHLGALDAGSQWTALYVVATCGAMLACSDRDIAVLGLANLIVVPVLMWLTISGFVSLWCFWAAMASVVIAWHLRRSYEPPITDGLRSCV